MIFYAWTALSGKTSDVVVCLGITGDREKARLDTEESLLDARGSNRLAAVALRAGQKLEWDGPAMKTKNAVDIARFIKREYRAPWKI